MNQNVVTPKQQAEFYGLLLLVSVIVGSIAGSYLFPVLGLCQEPVFLGQILGGATVVFIVILFHNRSLVKENEKFRLIIRLTRLRASLAEDSGSEKGAFKT